MVGGHELLCGELDSLNGKTNEMDGMMTMTMRAANGAASGERWMRWMGGWKDRWKGD